jgi:hypothetical protein
VFDLRALAVDTGIRPKEAYVGAASLKSHQGLADALVFDVAFAVDGEAVLA